MATPNVGILTTAGKALIDKVNSGQAKISFSKIVFSSMDNSQLSDMQVKALTAIAPQEVVVSSPETTLDTNSGETRIRATGTNEKLADGVYVKTYGVFAKDDTGSEILYGVTVSPNPNYFPAYDGVTPQAVTYSYKTVIQETSNITMTNSNDVYASQEDLTEAIAAIPKPDLSNYATNSQLATKADDSKVVHKTGDEEISGSKTFDTAPVDKTTGNPYITVTDLNNGLSTKVTDNKNGTEQLNGVQVQPFNKLSDTIGGRNLAPNTSDDWQKVSVPGGWGTANLSNKIYEIKDGETYTLQVEVRNMTSTIMLETFNFTAAGARNGLLIPHAYTSDDTKIIVTFTAKLPENYAYFQPNLAFSNSLTSAGSYEYRRFKFEEGSVATDWTPAPEDKVNVADMRKPANDVAGIEEVNAKQDKIGYTPANDSKVVHSTVTQLNSTDMNTVLTAGFYQLNSGTNGMPNADTWTLYQVIQLRDSNGVQIAYQTNRMILGIRSWNNYGKDFTDWIQFADDSKVAHLSGANNFDTVPTVNNNPLLLASSLPSDLARIGSNQEFTGKNTFDTAPIDKTTGNPYITKDGVPKVDLSSYATNRQLATKADDSKVVHRSPDTGRATDATDFPYKDLKVDGYPVIPFVLVPDRKTALAKTAQYPNYAFMYGKELN